MLRLFYYLFSMLFSMSGLYAFSSADAPITVTLETESRLLPLYIHPIADERSGYSKEYLAKLEQVVRFDFSQNGTTCLVTPSSALPFVDFDDMGAPSFWRSQNIYFVLKLRAKPEELSVRMLAVLTGKGKSIDLPLTGDLSQDRRTLHLLADGIHKTLFGFEGVASKKILYTVKTANPNKAKEFFSTIWEADYDGANAKRISADDAGYCLTPLYVPPKEGFSSGSYAYVSYKTGQPKIYLASLKNGLGARYSLLKGNQLMPAISKQRDKIAFISDITGNPDLFIQDFNPETGPQDKPRQIFATYKATQGTPSFSPDGSKIAFVSNKDGSPRIYVMDIPPPGRGLKDIRATLLSKLSKESTAPAWSPDGSKIAYCSMTNGTRQICLFDLEKREEKILTTTSGHKENPSWGPNSLHLVYNTTDVYSNCELYIMNINQPGSVKISQGAGEKRFPCWEP